MWMIFRFECLPFCGVWKSDADFGMVGADSGDGNDTAALNVFSLSERANFVWFAEASNGPSDGVSNSCMSCSAASSSLENSKSFDDDFDEQYLSVSSGEMAFGWIFLSISDCSSSANIDAYWLSSCWLEMLGGPLLLWIMIFDVCLMGTVTATVSAVATECDCVDT